MRELLDGVYDEPDAHRRSCPEVLQAITSHRADGEPLSLEAGVLRVADALDMAKGRSRIPFERGSVSMHSLSAAAIDEVTDHRRRDAARSMIEIVMNNSSGIYQVDGLLEGEAARLGPRAVRRGGRAHRHRRREAPRARVPARDRSRRRRVATGTLRPPLRGRLTAGRLARTGSWGSNPQRSLTEGAETAAFCFLCVLVHSTTPCCHKCTGNDLEREW